MKACYPIDNKLLIHFAFDAMVECPTIPIPLYVDYATNMLEKRKTAPKGFLRSAHNSLTSIPLVGQGHWSRVVAVCARHLTNPAVEREGRNYFGNATSIEYVPAGISKNSVPAFAFELRVSG